MRRRTPRPDIPQIDSDVPMSAGARQSGFIPKTNKRKSEVIDEAFAKWRSGDYGKPLDRGVLRTAAEAHVDSYLGKVSEEGNEFIETTKRIQQLLRKKARMVQANIP